MRLVVVGNGIAGIEAALAARARLPEAEIAVVSEESDHLFSRTALMYVLCGQLRQRDIEPRGRELYEQQRLRRVRARAVGVDLAGHRLLLGGGLEPLPYDRLLLATGSRPRPCPWPGAELPGVGHFVTLQDLAWLEAELHGGPGHGGPPPNATAHLASSGPGSPYWPRPVARAARGRALQQPVVIGGGLIGCEVVETLLSAGLRPRLLVRQGWFWPAFLDAEEGVFVAEHLRAHGVEVHLDCEVEALLPAADGTLGAVRTRQGELPCDLAVVAIGVRPNTGWLQGSGIALDEDGGVLVDEGLNTSAPDVLAAGDCASVPWADGRRAPETLWYTARDQGRVAGRRLAGEAATHRRGIWYNSAKFLDIEYTTVGLVNQGLPGERSVRWEERGAVHSSTRLVAQGGRLVGFNALGRRWEHSVLARWIEEGRSLRYALAHLDRAAFDGELVPPLCVPRSVWEGVT